MESSSRHQPPAGMFIGIPVFIFFFITLWDSFMYPSVSLICRIAPAGPVRILADVFVGVLLAADIFWIIKTSKRLNEKRKSNG